MNRRESVKLMLGTLLLGADDAGWRDQPNGGDEDSN